MDRSGAIIQELTDDCISALTTLLSKDLAIQDRLADFKLWADSVHALASFGDSPDSRLEGSEDELALVESVLSMLVESLNYLAALEGPKFEGWDHAVSNVDSGIADLILIGSALQQNWRWPDAIDAGSGQYEGGITETSRLVTYQGDYTLSAKSDTHKDDTDESNMDWRDHAAPLAHEDAGMGSEQGRPAQQTAHPTQHIANTTPDAAHSDEDAFGVKLLVPGESPTIE